MSEQIETGYAEPPEQWIVAHQVQPTPVTAAVAGAHPHAARPGAMATVAESHGELVDRCHRAEARVAVLEVESRAAQERAQQELETLSGWLRELTEDVPATADCSCLLCGADVESSDPMVWIDDSPDRHETDCAWAQAARWVKAQEAGNE